MEPTTGKVKQKEQVAKKIQSTWIKAGVRMLHNSHVQNLFAKFRWTEKSGSVRESVRGNGVLSLQHMRNEVYKCMGRVQIW